jgi:anti-sigma regulatory factor (Ser/Thr protein kinase)
LVTNAIRHGSVPEESQLVVTIEAHANQVRLGLSYPGPMFAPPAGLPAPDVAAGRGLAIVNIIADRWGITQSEGMVVWFEIDH